jgi:PLP dependent protein
VSYFLRYEAIREEAIRISGNPNIVVIAVSKKHPYESFREAYLSGIRIFGENSVKEGLAKIQEFQMEFPTIPVGHTKPILHHIGPMQTGSLRKLFGAFDYTHGVGSVHSMDELCKRASKETATLSFFLQLNLTKESTKNGLDETEIDSVLKKMEAYTNENLIFSGLMTMGPSQEDPIKTREVFKKLRLLRDEYFPGKKLSMGMSGDYTIALEEGADLIRIGTAIFGERKYG